MEQGEQDGLQHCGVPSLPAEHPGSSFPLLFLFLACSGFFIVMVTEIWCRGSEMHTALSSLGGHQEDPQNPLAASMGTSCTDGGCRFAPVLLSALGQDPHPGSSVLRSGSCIPNHIFLSLFLIFSSSERCRSTTAMGDSIADPARGSGVEPGCVPQGNGAALSVITEGVGELAVIDPEVAKKACEEVLEKVKLMHGVSSDSPTDGGEAERGLRAAGDLANGELVEGCEIRCLDDLPSTASRIQEEEDETAANTVRTARKRQKNNSAKQSWLLRLFESKLFDISMAISYLYNSKEPGVQAYIGNRLFCFRNEDVDFYLPQLLNMYIHMDEDVGDAIKPYIVHRCRQSINFSLQCALLLGAYSSDMHISTQRHSRGTKLRKLILSDELKPAHRKRELPSLSPAPDVGLSPSKRTHQRSKSDATVTISLSSNLKRTASNPKVESEEEVMLGLPRTRPGGGRP